MLINGKEVNVSAAFPLLVGDWKKLEQQGVSARALADKPSVTLLAQFALYVCAKAAPPGVVIAEPDIDTLTMDALTSILSSADTSDREKPNRPT